MSYSIGQVAKLTGLGVHTLRYYEKEGLLPFVAKNSSGIRCYSNTDLQWLTIIECLKASGLQIKEIAQYIQWLREGDATLPERAAMFQKRKDIIAEEMAKLQLVMDKITFKTKLYEEALKLGSLAAAENLPKIKKLKKELFDKPSDFDKIAQQL